MSENCQTYLDIHASPGSTQRHRKLMALNPDYALVDERSLEDLVRFTSKFSQLIHYYNLSNEKEGTWAPFFSNDLTAILCMINALPTDKLLEKLFLTKKKLAFEKNTSLQKIIANDFKNCLKESLDQCAQISSKIPTDYELNDYFQYTYLKIKTDGSKIITEIDSANDWVSLFLQRNFIKRVHTIIGLCNDWKSKSNLSIVESLQSYPKHTPHYGLYLAFLQLFQLAQKELNTFTLRHLEFYYKKVLRISEKESKPDCVHLCIEPNPKTDSFLIPSGTDFVAGKDANGNTKLYSSTMDTVISKAKIKSIYTVFNQGKKLYQKDLSEENGKIEGTPWFTADIESETGYAIASPLFLLQSGQREITLPQKFKSDLQKFKYYFSGENGWLEVPLSDGNKLILNDTQDAIIRYNTEIHEGVVLHTDNPVLKMVSQTGLDYLSFSDFEVSVSVKNAKHFKLFNLTGEVDLSKPFLPFGEYPENGNTMLFTSNEFLVKPNSKGTLFCKNDEGDFYNTQSEWLSSGKWNFVSHSNDKKWNLKPNSSIFNVTKYPFKIGKKHKKIDNKSSNFKKPLLTTSNPFQIQEDQYISHDSTDGYFRITLKDNRFEAGAYMKRYYTAVQNNTDLPKVHKIDNFSFDYTAKEVFHSAHSDNLFALLPFGYHHKWNDKDNSTSALYLGLENVLPKSTLHVLFQFIEGTANPFFETLDLKFQYLIENQWVNIPNISDNTLNFSQSGIIHLNLPEWNLETPQTQMPNNQFWIRVLIPNPEAICDFVGVHTQAIKAVLHTPETQLDFEEPLAPNTISKLYTSIPQVKKVHQYYPSFGGQPIESESAYHTRVSELLRHKNRAITSWDYERMILGNFPEVAQIKCLNHLSYTATEINSTSAGTVTLIPIARKTNSQQNDFFKPFVALSTQQKILQFLKDKTSPHVQIRVKNPVIEELSLECKIVKKEDHYEDEWVKKELFNHLQKFISPWISDDEFEFSKTISISAIIQLLDESPWVDYISNLKLFQGSKPIEDKNEDIVPKTVFSVFILKEASFSITNSKCCAV